MIAGSQPLARAWLIVGLLWFVAALNYLDRNMITTMRASLVGAIIMTDAQFGLLTSIFLWVYGLLSPFAGFLADRFSRSRVVLVSLFVWSAITWLTGHARTFEQLLVARALMGVSEACYIPAAGTSLLPLALAGLVLYGLARAFADSNMMPILCLISDPRYRATGYGVLNLFSCLVGGAGIYAGGALRDAHLNLSLLFQLAAASLLLCAGLLFLVKPAARPGTAVVPLGKRPGLDCTVGKP